MNGWRRPALLTTLAGPTVVVLVNRMVVEKYASPAQLPGGHPQRRCHPLQQHQGRVHLGQDRTARVLRSLKPVRLATG